MDKAQQDALKKAAGIEAAKLIQNGMIAGLGTGSTVRFLVDELGRRVKEEGLEFTGVTTSRRTQEQAGPADLHCGRRTDRPGIFTRVSAYHDWITATESGS